MLIEKIIIFALLAIILYSLGSGFYYLMKPGGSHGVVKALTVRLVASFVLVGLLFFAFFMGWITPAV